MLQFFSGSTSIVNSKRAITDCLESALGEGNFECDLIVIYAAIGHNLKEILTTAHSLSPRARIIGCTCAGIIGTEGANESIRALAVMAIKGSQDHFAIAGIKKINGMSSYEASVELAKELQKKNQNINMIHFLASGIDISSDKCIEGIESVFGNGIPVFGATSSDNMRAIGSFQFIDDQIFEMGATALGFADPGLEVITQASHGFVTIGMPFTVTRSEANRVYEINNEPAWNYFIDRLGLPEDASFSQTIPIGALAEELPEELHQEYGNSHILRVVTKKHTDGSFFMPVDCPEGTKLWMTKRDEERIFSDLDVMMKSIEKRCAKLKAVAVFHADCLARGRYLFNRVLKDEIVSRMQYPICKGEPIPWLGMYGFGEFAQLNNKNTFHNYSTALYVLLRKT